MKTSQWRTVHSAFHAMLIAAVLVVASIAGALPARAADAFLEGRVVNAAGTPINGIRLDIFSQPDGGEIGTTATSAVTNSLGQYSVDVTSGASYRIKFTDTVTTRPAGPFPTEWHLDAATLETATPVPVPSPGVTSIADTVLVAPVVKEFDEAPAPAIGSTGKLEPGSYLSAILGTWSPAPTYVEYKWYRNGSPVLHNHVRPWMPSTYSLYGQDGGSQITVAVTVSKPGYVTTTRKSEPFSVPLYEMAPAIPVVTGTALTGNVLKADPGTWVPANPAYSYEWFRSGSKVPGITGSSYRLTEADLGHTLTVTVTGNGMGYETTSKSSSPTGVVARGSFTPVTPVITGLAVGGSALTAQPGDWGLSGAQFAYQWYRSGTPIAGAVKQAYYLVDVDLGKTLSVKVTATASGVDPASSGMSESTAVVVPGTLNEVTPQIAGETTSKVGQSLSVRITGTPMPGSTYRYQWYRNGTAIGGATKSMYYPGADDLGTNTYTVRATVSKSGYTSYSKTSAPFTATVAKGDFTGIKELKLSTHQTVGATWSFDQPYWSPSPSFAVQWYRDGVAVKGATSRYYRTSLADLGTHTYKVVLIGSKPGYNTATKSKTATLTVQKANLEIFPDAKLTGTAKVGYTLTATRPNQSWKSSFLPDQNMVPTVRYQWYRSGVAIKGATGKTYKLTGADAGKTIKARFTISLIGYNTVYPYTKSSAVVAKGTLRASAPSITGTKKVGYRLTAKPNTWTAGTKFKYQWYRSGKAIKGATGSTYKLVSADRYDSIKVRVTGYQTGWNTASRYSGSTTKVR